MIIKVTDQKIVATNKLDKNVTVDYGSEMISKVGFQAVDNAVEKIIPIIGYTEEVFMDSETVEAKMIARKIEDKIKRDVVIIRNPLS